MRLTRTCTALVAAAALAALPASASAAAQPVPPGAAVFEATLSGSQVTTWDNLRAKNQDDPCSSSSEGHGDQTLRFAVPGKFKLIFAKPPKGQPNLFGSHGLPLIYGDGGLQTARITAERNGEYTVHTDEIDQSRCPGQNGGGVDPTRNPKDCGTRSGSFNTNLQFHDDGTIDDDLFVPIPGGRKSEKKYLTLFGTAFSWADAAHGTYAATLDELYQNCPMLLNARAEREGAIYASQEKLPATSVFDKRKKKLVVSGSVIAKVGEGDTTGQTIEAWNLRLKRVK
ncbi:MAG: hypothetical protein QOJ07_2434 [Thermoleophilaceae bacterium]|jgi:hypothetical protein|nr:hypothetical protein [Thermoleophilaceae bacterium]